MLTTLGKKGFISFGGVYVLQAEVLTDALKFEKPPKIIPSYILNDPPQLHHFLFETQALLLLDKKQDRQVFLVPRSKQENTKSTSNPMTESNSQVDNGLNLLPSLTTKQTALVTSGESLEKIFKSDKLWNLEDRWANKQKRSDRLQTSSILSKNEELLFSSVARGDIVEIKKLVSKEHTSLNIKQPGSGISPLHVACQYEDIPLVKALVEMGADVNISSSNGSTPLHWAAQQGSLEVVEFLLSQGANVFATTNSWLTDSVYGKSSGQTPLHWAAEKGNIQVVFLLLKYGSMPHVTDEAGKSAKDLSKDDTLTKLISEEEDKEYTPIIFSSSSGVATNSADLDSLFRNKNNNNNNNNTT